MTGYPVQSSWASLVAQLVKNLPAMQRYLFSSWLGKICWRNDKLPTPVLLGFLGGSAPKGSTCNAGDLCSIPGLGRLPGEWKGYPLQYSGLEHSMDSIVHGTLRRHFLTIQEEKLGSFPRTLEHFHFSSAQWGKICCVLGL